MPLVKNYLFKEFFPAFSSPYHLLLSTSRESQEGTVCTGNAHRYLGAPGTSFDKTGGNTFGT
jgi:hypothetical protein